MYLKHDREFWSEVKRISNSQVKLPSTVGDARGMEDVAEMWSAHYESIVNSVD